MQYTPSLSLIQDHDDYGLGSWYLSMHDTWCMIQDASYMMLLIHVAWCKMHDNDTMMKMMHDAWDMIHGSCIVSETTASFGNYESNRWIISYPIPMGHL